MAASFAGFFLRMKSANKTLRQVAAENLASMKFYSAMAGVDSDNADLCIADLEAKANKPKRQYTKRDTDQQGQGESEIQKDILKALRTHPTVAWAARFNSSNLTLTDEQGANRYVRANTQRGMSDLAGMLHGGRFFAIEVKSATGTLYDHQAAFLEKIRNGGGIAGVARSVADAVKLIES